MAWSPQDAMEAYLHTHQLCKVQDDHKLIEPRCMEFLSALAAGKRAKLMVQVTAEGITPLTIALAVAAKQTGGQLVCILLQREQVEKSRAWLIGNDLEDVVIELDYGNPCEVIVKYMSIDFAVIDCRFEDHLRLSKMMKLNPTGSVVVADNLKPVRDRVPFVEVLKGKQKLEFVTLPIGEGMELTRFGSVCKRHSRRSRDFMLRLKTELFGSYFYYKIRKITKII